MRTMHLLIFFVTFSTLFISAVLISLIVRDAQPVPYMDEIFHVPQAQKYCSANFTHWDPKITTPPGLYFTSLGFVYFTNLFLSGDLCTTYVLRCTNILMMLGNFWLSCMIVIRLAGARDGPTRSKLIISSAAATLLPVLYFFTFLYYTDPGTTLFLQLMYLYSLFDHHWLAAACGGVAVLYRQTSIIWVFMIAGCKALDIASKSLPYEYFRLENLSCSASRLMLHPLERLREAIDLAKTITKECGGYIAVGAAFAAFLILNGGIVLGDKAAHQSCLHLAQLGYFLLFAAFHGAPYLFTARVLEGFWRSLTRRPFLYAALIPAFMLTVTYSSHVHPYLVADNRHLTFYIWRRLLGRSEIVRCLLVPLYVYTGYAMLHQLAHKSTTWRLLFCLAVLTSTVPQKLLELRYFIFPFLFFRLHIQEPSYQQIFIEMALNITVNAAVMHLFLTRTFMWEGDTALQRFMW